MAKPLSVYELTLLVRETISANSALSNIWVSGELSNFRPHSSGHCYFTLKDERATLRMVMWRSKAATLNFKPQDGMRVLARGSIAVYERDGNYQLIVDRLEPDGLGAMYAGLMQLKQRLQQEGLFDPARKRALPPYPQVVAVLTSPTGAAVQDVLAVLKKRWPVAEILIFPVLVQGAEAPATIVSALADVAKLTEIDVVIVGRGGGSLEDLWAFNDEGVARAIAACARPVVSAVGHESDFTLADLVADLRAPTPSGAALLVSPDQVDVERRLTVLQVKLNRAVENRLASARQHLDYLAVRLQAKSPGSAIVSAQAQGDKLSLRLHLAIRRRLEAATARLSEQATRLHAISPLKVLARGYSVTRAHGSVLTNAKDVAPGDHLVTHLHEGTIYSVVTGKEKGHEF